MREIIKIVTQETAGYVVVVTGLTDESMTADNVLGIINESQQKVLYTPVSRSNMQSAVYSAGTLTITLAQSVAEIAAGNKLFVKLYSDSDPSDDAHNLASFFNITEATEYTALTPAEAIAIARDCQYNVMGDDWPIPTWLPTGVTEAQVESAAEGLGIPYHEPTQTA